MRLFALYLMITLFNELDEEVQSCFSNRWVEFGITRDLLEGTLDKMIASGDPVPPLPNIRKLQKIEEVINVWYAPHNSGGSTLVFQTTDNCLWQLCDVGLGGTNFSQVDSNWRVVEKIKKYLPARINPRPKNSRPWNYEFDFGKGVFMWVKKNDVEKSFKWGIRVATMK